MWWQGGNPGWPVLSDPPPLVCFKIWFMYLKSVALVKLGDRWAPAQQCFGASPSAVL